jgi:hypothetical protein
VDLSKYPLDKLLYFIAGILPGFVAVFIFELAAPGSFRWFFALGFLGYKTKLGVALIALFVIGFSMTTILNAILGAMGGAIGTVMAQRPYTPSYSLAVAPWRDSGWRTVAKKHLGTSAPQDTQLMSQELYDLRGGIVKSLSAPDQPGARLVLERERFDSQINDSQWEQWYEQFHQTVLQPSKTDFVWHVRNGLNFNLETASLYLLLSAAIVPAVRHWWCILPASLWVLLLVAESYSAMNRYLDKWSTLRAQIEYLHKSVREEEAAIRGS